MMLTISLILLFIALAIYSCFKIYKIMNVLDLNHSEYKREMTYTIVSSLALIIPALFYSYGYVPSYVVSICAINDGVCILLAGVVSVKYDLYKNFSKYKK
jgi:hypothetical protein